METFEDEDFDYEISNKVVSEYLNSLGYKEDFYFENQSNHDQIEEITNKNNQKSTASNPPSPLAFIVSKDFFYKFIQKNENLVRNTLSNSDYDTIIAENLNFLTDSNENNFSKFVILNWKTNLFLVSSLILFISAIYRSKFYFLLVLSLLSFIVFINGFKIFNYFLIKWLKIIQNLFEVNKNLLFSIKQNELIELSVKRKYLIESKKPIENDSDINLTFRKAIFFNLRSIFFKFKAVNLNMTKNFDIESSNFICSIDINHLSEVMKIENGDNLDKATDNYSYSCISSLNKLNSLLISENLKLIILCYFKVLKNDLNFLKLFLFIFKSVNLIYKSLSSLIILEKICKLIEPNESDAKPKKEVLTLEKNLSLNLRNSLLNSYQIVDTQDPKLRTEKFKILKNSFEICTLYFKQLELSLEGQDSVEIDSQKEDSKLNIDVDKCQKIDKKVVFVDQEVLIEDEIFEAENHQIDNEDEKGFNCQMEELTLKEKQEILNTKNLFYELKFALKPKTNEWVQREREIKKKYEQKNVITKTEFGNEEVRNDHLLDNEVLLYKSEIRKRRSQKSEIKKEFPMTKNQKYKYEEFEQANEIHKPKMSFMNEIMSQRNFIFKLNENEDDDDEEILSD
ncbi:unnamed protein product [Brachionus calyciflorus]|uniref:Vezatin n=1 Tax=Brachionus calyciflorus TaxID=104777 RepID=A0A813T0V9_9BILA|nr:unnamed protein product [Brachionus calyciflorus]